MGCGPGGTKYTPVKNEWWDPLGPRSGKQATGAIPIRSQIFDYVRGQLPQSAETGTEMNRQLKEAAQDPGYKAAADMARRSISGEYLKGSPQLDAIVANSRAAAQREAANAAAGLREQYARAGMSFGTPALQAMQSANAAASAKANADEAQLRYTNYEAERQRQLQAPQLLTAAQMAPVELLNKSAGTTAAALAPLANMITGLAGGGQVVKPDMTAKQSLDSYVMDQIGKL
jgi:hypothetical protein